MSLMRAIDLFCGCGGISCGLEWAGIDVVAGVDVEPKYAITFQENFPSAKFLDWDLSEVSPQEFMNVLGLRPGDLDLLVGGPPCQGFSKNVPRRNRFMADPKNQMVRVFLEYCEAINPSYILMENVAEMKNGFEQQYTVEILERLTNDGYEVTHAVLNAADYAVPQRRKRAFFLATRLPGKITLPPATHHPRPDDGSPASLFESKHHVSVWEAIGDLPSLGNGEGTEPCDYDRPPKSEFQKLVRRKTPKVWNHIARDLRPTQLERISSLKPGQGHKDLPKRLQVKGGYSGAYGRLTRDMVAPTITRWVFHPGSGRWGHPEDKRLITMREAARIQGFPDWFVFHGSYVEQAGQIGNAVPPLLARAIARQLVEHYERSTKARSSSKGMRSSADGTGKVIECSDPG